MKQTEKLSLFGNTPPELERFIELTKRITYKPGYRISVERDMSWNDNDACLWITARVPNSLNPSEMTSVNLSTAIPPYPFDNDKHRLAFIHNCIMQMERHEVDEFFKLDEKCVHDPHPEVIPNWYKKDFLTGLADNGKK